MAKPLEFISRIKNLATNNFSTSKTFGYEKEAIAAGILVFPNFIHASLVFIPAITALFVYLFSPWIIEGGFSGISTIQNIQLENLLTTIEIFKLVSIVLIGYFGVIKFQQIKDTGDYGYWLALGVDRLSYYNYNILGFTFNALVSATILVFHIALIENFYLPLTNIVFLLILIFSSMYLFSSLLFFVYEAIDNAEMTFLTIITTYIISIIFITHGNPLHSVLNAELYFSNPNWHLLFMVQLGFAGVFHYLGWRLHREIDVELGG